MEFKDITEHLGNRGFVTREKWENKSFLVFGMDNSLMCIQMVFTDAGKYKVNFEYPHKIPYYSLSLDDIKADDWIAADLFWDGSKDDYLPFE